MKEEVSDYEFNKITEKVRGKKTYPSFEIGGQTIEGRAYICNYCKSESVGPKGMSEWTCNICGGYNTVPIPLIKKERKEKKK